MAGGAIRGAAAAPAGGCLSDVGSLSEADDAVQEAWVRLNRTDADAIENLGGWLTTVVGRVSLNMLRSRRRGARSRSTCACPTQSSIAPTG